MWQAKLQKQNRARYQKSECEKLISQEPSCKMAVTAGYVLDTMYISIQAYRI